MNFSEAWQIAFPQSIAIIFIVALDLSVVGFFNFVYFMSIGYGLAISGSGVTLLILYRDALTIPTVCIAILLILYGLRLSLFLFIRERKSASYKRTLDSVSTGDKPMPIFVKFAIWIACSAMYTTQVSPLIYTLENEVKGSVLPTIAVVIMAAALLLETIADRQKSLAKIENPDRFCDRGLYEIVRCPNYLGEICFWTGLFLSAFTALSGIVQWSIACIGYLLLLYIMFGGAKRLEKRQIERYGNDPEFIAYVWRTPILIPLIPIYSLQKHGFLK